MIKNYSKILLSLFVVIILSAGCVASEKPASKEQVTSEPVIRQEAVVEVPNDSKLAPNFKLDSLKQDSVELKDFKNKKAVLLLFWTTWCPYCRDQLMQANDKYPQFSKQGLELLAINIGEPAESVARFVKLRNLSFSFLLDYDSAAALSFEVQGIPTYILVDKNGYIVARDNVFPEEAIKNILSK